MGRPGQWRAADGRCDQLATDGLKCQLGNGNCLAHLDLWKGCCLEKSWPPVRNDRRGECKSEARLFVLCFLGGERGRARSAAQR